MEYLDGSDLADWLRTRGPLPIEQAVELVVQACEAIAEAHTLGIVHRDLKPANLFVIKGRDGLLKVKVLDFGIAKSAESASGQAAMTGTRSVLGSPEYMSPEQFTAPKTVGRAALWTFVETCAIGTAMCVHVQSGS
jgi:serine/threonine-protein kinase